MAKLSPLLFLRKFRFWLLLLPSIFFLIWIWIIFVKQNTGSNSPESSAEPRTFFEEVISPSPPKPLTEEEVSSGNLNIAQDDERLLRYISENHLVKPGNFSLVDWAPVYKTNKNEQQEVSRYVLNFFRKMKHGTFIECGASDGDFYSNTMLLEKDYNWTGLLIESDPKPLNKLLQRNRNAWISASCLSTSQTPKKMTFLRNEKGEGLSFLPGKRMFIGKEQDYRPFEAQCFPLYSILKAINLTTVDYFSLDIEGAELDVLKTIPWDKVLIKFLSIEVHPEYMKQVRDLMTAVGYKYITFIRNGYSHDQIYAHPSTFDEVDQVP